MATIVNTPAATHEHMLEESSSASSANTILWVVVAIILAFMLFYFGLPILRSAAAPRQAPQQINNYAPPQGGNQAPQVNIPDKVNVDINPNAGGNAPEPQK